MTEKRERSDIEAKILEVAGAPGGAGVTRIVYRVVLNFQIVRAYLDRLTGAGLLVRVGDRYLATTRAAAYLENYRELQALRAQRPRLRPS